MKIGVIGTGNMGTILIEALLEAGIIKESELAIVNRTAAKALALKERHPGLTVSHSPEEAAKADLVFVCVKPLDIYPLLERIKPSLSENSCVVSITSPVSVEQLSSTLPCACARLIPSITNRALSGVSLLSFSENCPPRWQEEITQLAQGISEPVVIPNNVTRAASDIVSCGPAFISFLAQAMIDGAVQATPIDEKTAVLLTEKMLAGVGDLLKKEIYTLPSLQEKVCVKGGITGEGIKVLEGGTNGLFFRLFQATQTKFAEDVEKVEKQFKRGYF